MRRLQFLLLTSLVSAAALWHLTLGADHNGDVKGDEVRAEEERTEDADDCAGDLRTLVQEHSSSIKKLQADLTAYKKKLDAASMSVAFTARISTSRDAQGKGISLSHHQTVVFDLAITNVGNAYNTSTGVFTAPANGTYAFALNIMDPEGRPSLYLGIAKNGTNVKNVTHLGLVYAQGAGDSYDQGSTQVSSQLTAGDQVWVRQVSGSGVRGDWWAIFTGFLLQAY